MAEFTSGAEVSLEDTAKWGVVALHRGDLVEVDLSSTNWEPVVEASAAFLVLDTITEADRSLSVEVKCVGCENPVTLVSLMEKMGERGFIHLCITKPCVDPRGEGRFTLHTTRAKFWKWSDFQMACFYLEGGAREVIEKLVEEQRLPSEGERVPSVEDVPKKRPAARRPSKPKATAVKPAATPSRRAKGGGVPLAGVTGDGAKKPGKMAAKEQEKPIEEGEPRKDVTPALRARLRSRLEEAKKKVGAGEEEAIRIGSEEEEDSSGGFSPSSSNYAPEMTELTTGSGLLPRPPVLAIADGREDGMKEKRKRKKEKGKKAHSSRKKEDRDLGTSIVTTSSWRGQLLEQAVQAARVGRSSKKKRREKSSKEEGAAAKLTAALTEILGGDGDGKRPRKEKKDKKRKKKKKKRRRRVRRDGVIESCSSSSYSTSEISEESISSDTDMETPIRKRSRDSPGSILAMLTAHVKEQLEQSAAVDVNSAETSVTSGVKILTYFTLQLKTNFPTHHKELRELHHLAVTMDTLRRGDIARTGDSLAARFMAIHQSLLDQNWSAARHLELYPMEEATAASSSVILATRKHSKMVAKMQGYQQGGFWGQGRGRGKGGRGDWYGSYEVKGDHKGKKGKKGDAKGKGRGGGQGPGNKGDGTNVWKDNKEKES